MHDNGGFWAEHWRLPNDVRVAVSGLLLEPCRPEPVPLASPPTWQPESHRQSLSVCRNPSFSPSTTAHIYLWDLDTCACTRVLAYHPVGVQAIALSPDAAWLVSVGRDPERSVVLWHLATGDTVAVGRSDYALTAVAWRPGPLPEFVTVGDGGALLWTLEPTHLAQRPLLDEVWKHLHV